MAREVEIWGEADAKPEPLRLRLIKHGDGVMLSAVDKSGGVLTGGNLLLVKEGEVRLCNNVTHSLRFVLDASGRIKTTTY